MACIMHICGGIFLLERSEMSAGVSVLLLNAQNVGLAEICGKNAKQKSIIDKYDTIDSK